MQGLFTSLQLPKSLYNILNYIIFNNIPISIVLFIIAILMVLFSRQFKRVFLVIFILFEIYIFISLNLYFHDKIFVLIGFFSSLIFIPFLYLALKNGYSITIVNIIFIAYLILFYPYIKNSNFFTISFIFIIIFIISIITFILILKIKRKIFIPGGDKK